MENGTSVAGIRRIFVVGFPGFYGGAATELHDQIVAWLHIGLEINIIPTASGCESEYLYPEMVEKGVLVHNPCQWSVIQPGDPVIGFCNAEYLSWLPEIRKRTFRTIFVNCMTWLFDMEKQRMHEGHIGMFLYQNPMVLTQNMPLLRELNPDPGIRFLTFKPYFNSTRFPFHSQRNPEFFGCGRISRQDADKFSSHTLHIYEYFVSPKVKSGLFLGFDQRSENKIGRPYDWIRTARDHHVVSQQTFYRHCEIVLQPTDTTENWPRVGLEAMSSGSVLIVDNRGGWQTMVEHGKTGWLCNNEREFIYYASKMAFEPELRLEMALAAKERVEHLASLEASVESWKQVLTTVAEMSEI